MTDIIEKAREFAEVAHANQNYGHNPYTRHLEDVVRVLRRFGYDDETTLASGYLHDVGEDCVDGLKNVSAIFPDHVYQIVRFCTDEEGPNRRIRKQLTYARMAREIANWQSNPSRTPWTLNAIRVKVADRYANVACCANGKDLDRLQMYRKDHSEFFRTLHVEGACHHRMWDDIRHNLFG